jgi:hypothetical protein
VTDIHMSGFWTTVRNLVEDQGMTPEDAVSSIIDVPEYRENVVKLIAGVARQKINREPTRIMEATALAQMGNRDFKNAKQTLIRTQFALPNGTLVPYAAATAEQHRLRATWSDQRSKAYAENARLHSICAQVIEEAGVTCLGEIESIENYPLIASQLSDVLALNVEASS